MIKNKWAGISVIIVILCLVCAGVFCIKQNQKKSYTAIIYSESSSIKSPADGTIKEIYVKPQQQVKRGQLIAEIEVPSKEKISEVNSPRVDVAGAKARLKNAEEKYENAAIMYKDGVISQEKYDDILADLKTAQNAYNNAVIKAQNIAKAQAAAKNQVEITKIYARTDGTVNGKLLLKGAQTKTGDEILQLLSDSKKVAVYVDKRTSSKLEAGQGVLIKVPEYQDKAFNGSIDYISENAADIEGYEKPVYAVYISFDSNINSSVIKPSDSGSVYFLNNRRFVF